MELGRAGAQRQLECVRCGLFGEIAEVDMGGRPELSSAMRADDVLRRRQETEVEATLLPRSQGLGEDEALQLDSRAGGHCSFEHRASRDPSVRPVVLSEPSGVDVCRAGSGLRGLDDAIVVRTNAREVYRGL